MPSGSIFRSVANALNLGAASKVVRMGLKHNQLGGVLGAYFRGVQFPKVGITPGGLVEMGGVGATGVTLKPSTFLQTYAGGKGNLGRAATRIGALAAAGVVAPALLPNSDVLAGTGAAAAFGGVYTGLGAMRGGAAGFMQGTGGMLGRGALGLMAGSMVWSGLREPRPADYMMRG